MTPPARGLRSPPVLTAAQEDRVKHKHTVPQAVFDSPDARRVQHDGHRRACRELDATPRAMLDEGNPNHPRHDGIFGYDRDEFMARQYGRRGRDGS